MDSNDDPIIIIEAKSPDQDINDYLYQVTSYALFLNQTYEDKKTVLYTCLTNGNNFAVYPWDSSQAVFFLRFEDFDLRNEKFLDLRSNLSYNAFKQVEITKDIFEFKRPGINTLIKTFNDCHNLIWKKEKISPTDAFYEFSKIMFIKLKQDSRIHTIINSGKKPSKTDFVFSTGWIDAQVKIEPNPFDAILFRQIREDLEVQIRQGRKKRIFEQGERLNLKSSTTFEVVKQLQHFDLYGIDEDLNGRMFETFLNATVRGKDLGQFFTPRGVVHYMVETAPLYITANRNKPLKERIPYVLDGCCGSGGFLIDVMSEMVHQIDGMTSLTNLEREKYLESIRNDHLFGIDANEKIAKVSRLNMYLHGDGGSKIFKVDTLDKELTIDPGMGQEEIEGLEELRRFIIEDNFKFDIILTNPPFSMKYQASDKHEKKILKQYNIARSASGAVSSSEKSNVLFLERYLDLLKPETGELLTVIDDTVLNGLNSQKYRDFILENFIIIQIVSLPFNAFFRADANIKTSLIHLRKKSKGEQQGNIFMAITNNIGHDDHSFDTPERNNLPTIRKYFNLWKNGKKIEDKIVYNNVPDEPLGCPMQIFEVSPDELNRQRLDAFYYSPELRKAKERIYALEEEGKILVKRGSELDIIPEMKKAETSKLEGNIYKYFEIGDVTIDGTIVKYREDYYENLPSRARLMVRESDVIFAKNNSSRGTTVIIPKWFDGGLVTTGFIGIRPKNEEEALILWNIMGSEFFRKQIYYLSITASQPEVRESIFRDEMILPWPNNEDDKEAVINNIKEVEKARKKLNDSLKAASASFDNLIV